MNGRLCSSFQIKNDTNPNMCSLESAQANVMKTSEKSKPLVDEHQIAENETGKGKLALDRIDFVRDAHNRVTLYKHYNNDHSYVWELRERGHVACVQSRNQPKAWSIVVRCESEQKNYLESRILRDTIYQQQHGIWIVWSGPDVSKLALRFQEKAGCTEVWNKICQIQGKNLYVEHPVAAVEAAKEKQAIDRIDFVRDASILGTTEALKQHLDKSKAEAGAAQIRVNDLDESIRELERKHQDSEVQLRNLEQELSKSQAKNHDLKAKFDHTELIKLIEKKSESLKSQEVSRLQDSLEAKNYEIALLKLALENTNTELQSERKLRFDIAERLEKKDAEATNLSDENARAKRNLCDSQNRIEAAEKQNIDTVNEIAIVKRLLETRNIELENERKLHSKTLERLEKKDAEAAKLTDVLAKCKSYLCDVRKRLTTAEQRHEILFKEYRKDRQELCDTKQRLEVAEKQSAETIKEKEIMAEELAQWQRYRRKIGRAAQFGDRIGKENQEPTNLQSPAMSRAAWKRQSHESGSNGDWAKRARINSEKMPEEASAKNAANMASRSFDNIL